jgi:fumarate reductase subunit C
VTPTKTYLRPLPRTWWLRKPVYFLFMVRELSSVAVLGYAIFLVVLVARAGDAASFERFFQTLQSPWSVALHLAALALVLLHSITWIGLLPKVVVLWRGEDRIPPRLIAGVNYVAWLVLSAVVAWLVLR